MRRATIPVLTIALMLAVSAPMPAQGQRKTLPGVFAAYASGDATAIPAALQTYSDYPALKRDIESAIDVWLKNWRPLHAVFLLEIAVTALERGDAYSLDVVRIARDFVTSRPQRIGQRPDEDAFEIAWHKTVVAMLEGLRRPKVVRQYLPALDNRISASPSASGPPRLVDPWIELARGKIDEGISAAGGLDLAKNAPLALQHFDKAALYAPTKAEALTRRARVLLRLGRPGDALAALDAIPPAGGDRTVVYWSQLFRGQALDALERPADAAQSYMSALGTVSGAQSPAIALMALELRQGRPAEALRWAGVVRAQSENIVDPWWDYPFGDLRFFRERMQGLREVSRR